MDQLATGMNNTRRPDPDGDVVLKCHDQDTGTTTSFWVSSKVLRLASPVFVRMFSPSFQEGQELLHGDFAVVELQDDDPTLMNLILNVLHYQADSEDHVMDAEELARLAIHCDKYDCTKALRPWISTCFKNVQGTGQPVVDFGFQLLAAYMFNTPAKFLEISKAALGEMAPGFNVEWMQEDILALLPVSVPNAVTTRIKQTLGTLETELQSIESLLREYSRCYETSQLTCVLCGRILPGVAKKCHPCHNTLLSPRYCTEETRIAEYFAVLRKVGLWPTAVPFQTYSISDMVLRFTRAKTDIKHSCGAASGCPLIMNLDLLVRRVNSVQRNMPGLCLPCVRQDEKGEEYTKCVHT